MIAETQEETGIKLSGPPRRLFECYMSPGSFAERLTFFVAPYVPGDRVNAGGGLVEEGEDIEVIETTLAAALAMVEAGEIIDAKTITAALLRAGDRADAASLKRRTAVLPPSRRRVSRRRRRRCARFRRRPCRAGRRASGET